MVAPVDNVKPQRSPQELNRAENMMFQGVLNHANYQGKPWIPFRVPMEKVKDGVETYYPPLFTQNLKGQSLAFTISHKKYPENILGQGDSRTGFSVTVWEENVGEIIPKGVSAFSPPKYIVHTEFAPGSGHATEDNANYLALMRDAMRDEASITTLPNIQAKGQIIKAQDALKSIFEGESDKFPSDYLKQLRDISKIDLSQHDLQKALDQTNISSKNRGEYKGYALNPKVIKDANDEHTVQLAQYTQCPQGEPIKPGLKLVVKHRPGLLTTKDIPLPDQGDVLNTGNINHAPEITEIIDIGAILEGKANDSSYVVLRDNKQVANPYPFTQPSHIEKSQNFQLERLKTCLDDYVNKGVDAVALITSAQD